MKLLYRGNHYKIISQKVETIKTEIIACFRGQKYLICRPLIQLTSQKPITLKYRGVSYMPKQAFTLKSEEISGNKQSIRVN